MYLALAGRRPVGLADKNVAPLRAYRPLSIVSSLISPRQFIEGRLVASFPITILWQVKLLVLVIFNAGAVLVAPAVPFSIEAARFHKGSLSSRMPGRHTPDAGSLRPVYRSRRIGALT
jgi:hypothetical protein